VPDHRAVAGANRSIFADQEIFASEAGPDAEFSVERDPRAEILMEGHEHVRDADGDHLALETCEFRHVRYSPVALSDTSGPTKATGGAFTLLRRRVR